MSAFVGRDFDMVITLVCDAWQPATKDKTR